MLVFLLMEVDCGQHGHSERSVTEQSHTQQGHFLIYIVFWLLPQLFFCCFGPDLCCPCTSMNLWPPTRLSPCSSLPRPRSVGTHHHYPDRNTLQALLFHGCDPGQSQSGLYSLIDNKPYFFCVWVLIICIMLGTLWVRLSWHRFHNIPHIFTHF